MKTFQIITIRLSYKLKWKETRMVRDAKQFRLVVVGDGGDGGVVVVVGAWGGGVN